MTYEEVLSRLFSECDEGYREFHKKLLKNENIEVIGVRMPVLRRLARAWKGETQRFLTFPDEYYEVTFLKFSLYALLPFDRFCEGLSEMVGLLDNWATVDGFHAPCIAKHKEEFLPYIRAFSRDGREFVERYALVSLLHDYVEEQYLPEIFAALEEADGSRYYTGMGAAWLMAEVLIKCYASGLTYLKEGRLLPFVHNMAIRKASESFRLTKEQKEELRSFKKATNGGKIPEKG